MARPDHADIRSHETRRGPPAAAAHDGGDGPAGLRPVRLQLQRLLGRDRQQGRTAAESVRAWRQGNRPDAEGAERGVGEGAGGFAASDHGGARSFARQSGAGDVRVAPPAEQGRLGEGNLAYRLRSEWLRSRLCRRRFLWDLRQQRFGPCRSNHCLARRLSHHGGPRQDPSRGAARRCVAGARAGYVVRTDFVHYGWRAAREGARAGAR